jgi:hypothetical protein
VATWARFAAAFRATCEAQTGPPQQVAVRLHRLMFLRFLREAGFQTAPVVDAAFLDGYRWSLDDDRSEDALTPDVFGCLFDKHVSRRETGSYYTGRDVSDYIARATIIPAVLDAVAARCPGFLGRGVVDELVSRNVDLAEFATSTFAHCHDRRVRSAASDALRALTVLDPTCGCGEFLVAALHVLEPLYRAVLAPPARQSVREAILRRNLYGFDLMPEAVEIARMRLLLMLAATADRGRPPPLPRLGGRLRAGDLLGTRDPFPVVARRGGFSVILGNPPYVESSGERDLRDYRTRTCGNVYAFVVERAAGLLATAGRLGMIVPHSAFCTDRMAPLAALVTQGATTWISTYDIRPSKLFPGVDQRLAIFLRHAAPQSRIYSTRYHRWSEPERPHLFRSLCYLDVCGLPYKNSVPKAGDPIEARIWHKLHDRPPLGQDLAGENVVYYHNAPRYWVRAMTFAPYFRNERDGEKLSAQVRTLPVRDDADAAAVAAVLNSSLFCWWWLLLSDCRHLNRREIDRFPVGLVAMAGDCKRRLGALCRRLMADYRRHAVRKVCRYRATGEVIYDEFFPGRSKAILDDIDRVLAGHYGLTAEEVDFIINYDIEHRLGGR